MTKESLLPQSSADLFLLLCFCSYSGTLTVHTVHSLLFILLLFILWVHSNLTFSLPLYCFTVYCRLRQYMYVLLLFIPAPSQSSCIDLPPVYQLFNPHSSCSPYAHTGCYFICIYYILYDIFDILFQYLTTALSCLLSSINQTFYFS